MRVIYFFEPYSAVYSSSITPLPHQIAAVYERLLPMKPIRFVLADDPGAGKTVMTGLLIKELIIRRDVRRCMIICPGALVEQWQDELLSKFRLPFEILSGNQVDSIGAVDRCIVSVDTVAHNESRKNLLRRSHWDLIVCDEAHKMSATLQGNEVKYTQRFRLGETLGKITRHFLLLTATPHNGKDDDFRLFMSLVAPDRFKRARRSDTPVDISKFMRRLVKEDLLTFDGKPIFPERVSYTVNYRLSTREAQLYRLVTEYVVDGFNRAERLKGNKKHAVGLALSTLQRRLASSPLAIFKSLERRAQRLHGIADDQKFLSDDESLTSARTDDELRIEIQTLRRLADAARRVLQSGEDRKWQELSALLQDERKLFDRDGNREKLIIFTEHRDTLEYLQRRIIDLFGRAEPVAVIHGELDRKARRAVEDRFRSDKNLVILIATDAAGEGINLQSAHLMINYDLPWNPNRLEQRFGRIHRIGQTNVCRLWNLVTADTREGRVLDTLLKKLDNERNALGGKVFDILGKISFDDKPLSELIVEAIRHGDDPVAADRLNNLMNESLDPTKIRELLRERALTKDTLNPTAIARIEQSMARVDALKLQPYFVENFFKTAFKTLNGTLYPRGAGRFEIGYIPRAVRAKAPNIQVGALVCFAEKNCAVDDNTVELIAPGHPLFDAVIDVTLEKFDGDLQRGTVFVDDNDAGSDCRLMLLVDTADNRFDFVEIFPDGRRHSTGRAPYFEYRDPEPSELEKILPSIVNAAWIERAIDRQKPVGVALIVPKGRLDKITPKIFSDDQNARAAVEKIAMNAVMTVERALGNTPVDVSDKKIGFDIESAAPDKRLRFIEVKGRAVGADTVTVTENEIITALNARDNFILALVIVDGNQARVVYLKPPFKSPPDFGVVSSTYKISALIRPSNVLLDKVIGV